MGRISTHAPRTGSDGTHCPTLTGDHEFQPTLPARGATWQGPNRVLTLDISTHAPRTGSDMHAQYLKYVRTISTHAPRTGSDRVFRDEVGAMTIFQPTLPARGATRNRRTP